ncbi:MAG: phosphoribosylamine--glycine ligase [Treponema sp.]|jgi:phosphoribosylamine--glycine ligase|nr:phosphoribosylamine--glycine ligase [Treponema sp.]
MKILVIGGGGREHAIIKKLKENPDVTQVYAMPGNGGISWDATCLAGSPTDGDAAVGYAQAQGIDFTVVSPDDPLVQGVADRLRAAGIPTFGPSAQAAAIEGSKVFSKELMKTYGIPTAAYEVFDKAAAAAAYIERQNRYPVVIKADGLALGKGVIIAQNLSEAHDALKRIMGDKIFGDSGNRVVVEAFLTGVEVTVLAFTDSKTIVPLVSSMDHKRAFDNDEGPNTGGMGVIAPNPWYTPAIAAECMVRIFRPTIEAMNREGRPFKGCLYFGLMLTDTGPQVIEYNCRFGDPEAQAVLPLLETDLLTILQAVEDERLDTINVRFRPGASCCVILATEGYPGSYKTGLPITRLYREPAAGVYVFHAGTALKNGVLLTSGGRVLGVTACGADLEEAVQKAYDEAATIHFDGMYMRRDIGQKGIRNNYGSI